MEDSRRHGSPVVCMILKSDMFCREGLVGVKCLRADVSQVGRCARMSRSNRLRSPVTHVIHVSVCEVKSVNYILCTDQCSRHNW
jgi:hypothetical protein